MQNKLTRWRNLKREVEEKEKFLEINYLSELCGFYEWLERNSLSARAIVLWHALMYLWNKSYWIVPFTPAITSIIARTSMSKSSILKAREELKNAGLISVGRRKTFDTSEYKLVPFSADFDTHYKQNKTKQNKTKQNKAKPSPLKTAPARELTPEQKELLDKVRETRERLGYS